MVASFFFVLNLELRKEEKKKRRKEEKKKNEDRQMTDKKIANRNNRDWLYIFVNKSIGSLTTSVG